MAVCLSLFLIHRITTGIDIVEIGSLWKGLDRYRLGWLLLATLLLIPNWVLEAVKLRLVLSQGRSGETSFIICFKSVLSGVTLGIVTPARLGEYGGRMITFPKRKRAQVVGSTLVTSLSQTIVTIGVGLICSLVLLEEYQFLKIEWIGIISFVSVGTLIVGLICLPSLVQGISRLRFFKDLDKTSAFDLSRSRLVKVLGISFLRYSVYALQFLLVLKALGVELTVLGLLLHIPLIFLLQTLMPLPPITSLVGRASAAIVVLSQLGLSDFVILSASSVLWVINLVIPAFLGLGLIWRAVTPTES